MKAALAVAPTPTANANDKPVVVAPNPLANTNPLSNITPTSTDPTPVTYANSLSNTTGTVEVLLKSEFGLSSGEDSRPIDEQINLFRIGPLRQLAAGLWTPTPEQNKD